MKNDDNKCFLYCYIREFKNVITNNTPRITKKDLFIAEKLLTNVIWILKMFY